MSRQQLHLWQQLLAKSREPGDWFQQFEHPGFNLSAQATALTTHAAVKQEERIGEDRIKRVSL